VRLAALFCFAVAATAIHSGAHARACDDSIRLNAVKILRQPPQSWLGYALYLGRSLFIKSWSGYGVYLGQGMVITAAHVVGERTKPIVRIAGLDLPAQVIKGGNYESVDLTLLSVDEQRLPSSLQHNAISWCQHPAWPEDPVNVVIPEKIASSHIMSPSLLPRAFRNKFSTVISDVATTGDSGSGVFDVSCKCLLGIMSRKIVVDGKDLAKYFVPSWTIKEFLPADYH
jgi:Trypsin-like peptidase domain